MSAWVDELDVVGPRRRASVWGWALAVVGLAVCVHAADVARQAEQARIEAEAEVTRLERALRQPPVVALGSDAAAASSASSAKTVSPPLDAAGWRRAGQLASWLGHDWLATLDRVDHAAADQKLLLTALALDLGTAMGTASGGSAELRLQALAHDDASPLVWAATLGEGAQLRSRERLPQPVTGRWGEYIWRVQLTAPGGPL